MASVDLLLHPVRLRIVQALLGDRSLTTSDLAAELVDVPPATLYRQVAVLHDADVLEVVEQRKVRGTVERTYRLRLDRASVGAIDLRGMSVEDHRRAFRTFVARLLGDYDRYLERGDVDLGRDRVAYRQAGLYLSDEETDDVLAEIRSVVARHAQKRPAPGRRRRLLSTIIVPAAESSDGRAE